MSETAYPSLNHSPSSLNQIIPSSSLVRQWLAERCQDARILKDLLRLAERAERQVAERQATAGQAREEVTHA